MAGQALKRDLIDSETLNHLNKSYQRSNSDEKIAKVMQSVLLFATSLEKGEFLDKVIDFITQTIQEASLEVNQYNQILKLFEKFQIPLRVKDRLYFRAGIDGFNKAAEAFLAYGEENQIPFPVLFKLRTTILSLAASHLLKDGYHDKVHFNQKSLIADIAATVENDVDLLEKYESILEELDLLHNMIILEKNLEREEITTDNLLISYKFTHKLKKLLYSQKKSQTLEEKLRLLNLAIEEKYKKLEINLILQLLRDKNLIAILTNPENKNLLTYFIQKNHFIKEDLFATDFLSKLFRDKNLAKARQAITSLIPQENLSFASVQALVSKARQIMIREKNLAKREAKESSISLAQA